MANAKTGKPRIAGPYQIKDDNKPDILDRIANDDPSDREASVDQGKRALQGERRALEARNRQAEAIKRAPTPGTFKTGTAEEWIESKIVNGQVVRWLCRPGYRRARLRGSPGSPEYEADYEKAMRQSPTSSNGRYDKDGIYMPGHGWGGKVKLTPVGN